MAKIVILGSNGQLGTDLIKALNSSKHYIVPITRADLEINEQIDSINLSKFNDADYIINCIAITNVDGCEISPYQAFTVNAIFVAQLAKLCASNQITLLQISTDYVFNGRNHLPYKENDMIEPLGIYGLSKASAELAVRAYCEQYFIFRVAALFGIAGASDKGGNFVQTILKLHRERDSVYVINDQYTCPTHTLDVAHAICHFIDQQIDEYGTYHCVSSSSCSWFEFAKQIITVFGGNINKLQAVSYNDYPFKSARPQYAKLDNTKLAKYYKMPTHEKALNEYFTLFNQNNQY